MNESLATRIAEIIIAKWDPQTHSLDSEQVYQELLVNGVDVPENDIHEILESFKKAGLIGGPGYINSDAVKQHGAMVITSVNIPLLRQVEFD